MGRLTTAALLLVGCLGIEVWAQTPPSQPTEAPAAKEAPAAGQGTPDRAAKPEPATAEKPEAAPQSGFPLDKFKEFSAIMIGGPVPGTEDPIHIYRSGNLMRMEGIGSVTYHITDLAKQETHALARTGCLKYKNSFVRTYPFMFTNPANTFQHVPLRKETVDGHLCQVEEVMVNIPARKTEVKFTVWEAEDLDGFPIKVETGMHRPIQYKNVVLGPQDPTLFIFPDVCQDSEKTIGSPKKGIPALNAPKKAAEGKSQ